MLSLCNAASGSDSRGLVQCLRAPMATPASPVDAIVRWYFVRLGRLRAFLDVGLSDVGIVVRSQKRDMLRTVPQGQCPQLPQRALRNLVPGGPD